MGNDSARKAAYQAALDALLQETPSAENRADYDALASALLRWMARSGATHVMPAETGEFKLRGQEANIEPARPTYDGLGLSVAEAVVEQLKTRPAKADMQLKDLVKALKDNGFEFESDNPAGSMNVALKRRNRSYGDVVITGRGRWGLRDWYTKKELSAFAHKERTRAGMDAAKARGAQIGKKWKINASQAVEFKRLVDSDAKISHICEVFGISQVTVGVYKRKLANWKPGDPFPPPAEKESEDEGSSESDNGDTPSRQLSLVSSKE